MDRFAPEISAGSRPMWCAKCESEVATEVAADGQSLLCASCRNQVRRLSTPSLHPDIRRARDILDRLSAATSAPQEPEEAAPLEDEPVELDDVLAAAVSDFEPEDEPEEFAEPQVPKQFRVDRPHPAAEFAHSHVGAEQPQSVSATHAQRRNDEPHAVLQAPHFNVQPARPRAAPGRGESTWGQLMAYAGVAILTVGTALVVWGYLGGPATYAPTGWLVATVGQMLLLLGVVSLVAGGMQQTTHEVSSRVAHLNGRVIRIEQTANELLHGPHFGEAARKQAAAAERRDDSSAEQL